LEGGAVKSGYQLDEKKGSSSKLWFGEDDEVDDTEEKKVALKKSGYRTTSHSADLITEDIYVSDGSEDEDELDEKNGGSLELNLTASKMGLMRRGMSSVVFQPRTWVRSTNDTRDSGEKDGDDLFQVSEEEDGDDNKDGAEDGGHDGKVPKKEDVVNMDPAQRAAYLLAEKQKKLEEAKILRRKLESAENAGRDPCLFSKRTAFDIRMDQIEEKPWDRASGGMADITDYFNYGMGEEDWLEYSERQKIVRQELTDAARQKRTPDPTIVPVAPKTPSRQAPRVAVVTKKKNEEEETAVAIGPILPKTDDEENDDKLHEAFIKNNGVKDDASEIKMDEAVKIVEDLIGGAWGIPKGSKLAKMMEEQEMNKNVPPPPPPPPPPPLPVVATIQHPIHTAHSPSKAPRGGPSRENEDFHRESHHHGGYGNTQYPPEHPPPPHHGDWRGGRGFNPGRGGPPMPPHPGQGFAGRGLPPPPPFQQFGGRGFRGGGRGGRGGNFGGRGTWRR
jgi:hypothetical protein